MKKQYTAPAMQLVEYQIRERIGAGYDDISNWSPLKPVN